MNKFISGYKQHNYLICTMFAPHTNWRKLKNFTVNFSIMQWQTYLQDLEIDVLLVKQPGLLLQIFPSHGWLSWFPNKIQHASIGCPQFVPEEQYGPFRANFIHVFICDYNLGDTQVCSRVKTKEKCTHFPFSLSSPGRKRKIPKGRRTCTWN